MAKKTNTTTVSKKAAKNPTNDDVRVSRWLEDYLDLFSLKMKPVTEGFIHRISQELNEWSKKDDSLILKNFYTSKEIPKDAFYRWANTYPELKASLLHAKERISARREHGGMTRKFDPNFILNSMPMYDDDWKEFIAWKSKMKSQEDQKERVVIEINDLSKKIEVVSDGRKESE